MVLAPLTQEEHELIVKQIHTKIMMDCYQKEIKEIEKYCNQLLNL